MEIVFEYIWLHQKHSSIRQFNLTFCILFSMLSKTLEFLSFHIAHHMLQGQFSISLFFDCLPGSSQLWIASVIFAGMVHDKPLRFRNNLHSWPVILQCRKRWLVVSASSLQKKHLEHTGIPFPLSCLESIQLLWLATRQNKPLLVGFLFSRFLSMASDVVVGWDGSTRYMHYSP